MDKCNKMLLSGLVRPPCPGRTVRIFVVRQRISMILNYYLIGIVTARTTCPAINRTTNFGR